METLSRSRRVSGFWRPRGKQSHGRGPICAPRRQQISGGDHKKKAHFYRLVIVTDYYVPEERMLVDEDENGRSYRNQ